MPNPVPIEYCEKTIKKGGFNTLYLALTILAFHWSVVLYINSSFLGQFLKEDAISLLYTGSALVTIVLFLVIPQIITRTGNYFLAILFAMLECVSLVGMAFTHSAPVAVFWFMIHATIVPLVFFHADMFMEGMTGNHEERTGSKRGILLTITSLMGALATLVSGFLVGKGEPNFTVAYLFSALFVLPFIYIIARYFKSYADPLYSKLNIIRGLSCFWKNTDVRYVFCAHFLLQFFFAWMVIYTPFYLATVIGFNWEQIGLILFVGLTAYVFLEYPIGVIADTWIGEKEMMALGFLIIAVATSWFTFLEMQNITVWMVAMFMTRVGASFVETTTESYFFKQIDGSDTNLASIFRMSRPLSYVLGAVLGSIALMLFPFNFIFVILSFLMIPGLFFAMALHDTK